MDRKNNISVNEKIHLNVDQQMLINIYTNVKAGQPSFGLLLLYLFGEVIIHVTHNTFDMI